MLYVAAKKGVPTLIQEQNSYAGITNKILAKYVDKICVAYDEMERFFLFKKIIHTGNPIRKNILDFDNQKLEGQLFLKLINQNQQFLLSEEV